MAAYIVGPRGVTVPGTAVALEPGLLLELGDDDETWGPHVAALLEAGQLLVPDSGEAEAERPVVASYVVSRRGFTVPGGANVSLAPGTVLEVREGDAAYEGYDFAAAVAGGYLLEPGSAEAVQAVSEIPVDEFNRRNAEDGRPRRRRGRGLAALTDELEPDAFS